MTLEGKALGDVVLDKMIAQKVGVEHPTPRRLWNKGVGPGLVEYLLSNLDSGDVLAEAINGAPYALSDGSVESQLTETTAALNALSVALSALAADVEALEGGGTEGLTLEPRDWNFSLAKTTLLQATPSGLTGSGTVPLWDGSDLLFKQSSATFSMDLGTVGAQGLHGDHSEANNTGYDVYWAYGDTPGLALFSVPAGVVVDSAKVADLGGGSYTHWSRKTFFLRNDSSGNPLAFSNVGRACDYQEAYDGSSAYETRVLNAGTATSKTAIDLSGHVPEGAKNVKVLLFARNDASTARQFRLYRNNAGVINWWLVSQQMRTTSPFSQDYIGVANLTPGPDLAATLYYDWSSTPSTGLSVYVLGWELL